MVSKTKRLEEIAENKRSFRFFKKSIRATFPLTNPAFERDSKLYEAECSEKEAKDLETTKKLGQDNEPAYLDSLNIPMKNAYRNAAICYQQAGAYFVLLSGKVSSSGPKKALKCFKHSSMCYAALARIVKEESELLAEQNKEKPFSIYNHLMHESVITKRHATIAKHEAAYRRARNLVISLGTLRLYERTTKLLNPGPYSKK
ncbi:MAG: hypothetical protein WC979_06600 [Candidatus Pacearchaeota archaeon]|jgi:hypothetical protein